MATATATRVTLMTNLQEFQSNAPRGPPQVPAIAVAAEHVHDGKHL